MLPCRRARIWAQALMEVYRGCCSSFKKRMRAGLRVACSQAGVTDQGGLNWHDLRAGASLHRAGCRGCLHYRMMHAAQMRAFGVHIHAGHCSCCICSRPCQCQVCI